MELAADVGRLELRRVHVDQAEFFENVSSVLASQDEPFGSASIVAQWFVFREAASSGVRVMLDGQGADEVLAGYHKYFAICALDLLASGALPSFARFQRRHAAVFGRSPLRLTPGTAVHLLPRATAELVRRRRRRATGNPALTAAVAAAYDPPVPALSAGSRLGSELANDVLALNLPQLLRYEDHNSMAHSIEARVPFLDHELVELVFSLPDDWKIDATTTKRVFREAMAGIVPEEIRCRRDKLGFKADPAWTDWVWQRGGAELRANGSPYEREWLDEAGVRQLAAGTDGGAERELMLWRVFNLKAWLRQHWP